MQQILDYMELTRSVNKLILSQPAKSHIQDYVQGFIIN